MGLAEIDKLRPQHKSRHFADDIFKYKIYTENVCSFIQMLFQIVQLKWVGIDPVNGFSPYRRQALTEPILVSLGRDELKRNMCYIAFGPRKRVNILQWAT